MSQRISSVHSVSFGVLPSTGSSVRNNIHTDGVVKRLDTAGNYLQPAMETVDQIRCSYCHDLHDMNKATSDTFAGRPHLRGSWMGNPYAPDMPPISGYSYPSTGGANNVGNRQTWTGGTFNAADATPRLYASTSKNKGGYFIDQNSNWPTKDVNFNDPAKPAGLCTLCHGSDVNNMDYYTASKLWRSDQVNGHANSTLGGSGATHANARSAGASRAHNFSCSKCHTPHASGLPALLATNCLDRTVSTWLGGSKTAIRSNPTNAWVLRAQNNCHRKDDTASGWHQLAPGQ